MERAEQSHSGEIRVAIETALTVQQLRHGLTPRARALQVFAALGVWDTTDNNGVLIYVLLADRAIEIVADRAIAALVPQADWLALCQGVQGHFRSGDLTNACCEMVRGVGRELGRHFPARAGHGNELPNQPVLL